jgi:hypothetical protein
MDNFDKRFSQIGRTIIVALVVALCIASGFLGVAVYAINAFS